MATVKRITAANSAAGSAKRWWCLGLLAATMLPGCGQGELATLSGDIRYLDQHVADGGIRLFPLPGTPCKGAAVKVIGGQYQFTPDSGLCAGRYRVEIFAARPTGRKIIPPAGESESSEPVDEYESYLPPIFGVASILKIDLVPGENRRDFHLAKDGEKLP